MFTAPSATGGSRMVIMNVAAEKSYAKDVCNSSEVLVSFIFHRCFKPQIVLWATETSDLKSYLCELLFFTFPANLVSPVVVV